jgi:SAM-dependent methyltransferase
MQGEKVMSAFEKNYSAYYDLFYADKDYVSEVLYVADLLKKFSKGPRILEFGSGTGKHGSLLAAKGFHMYGIELSESMVAKAQEIGFPCEVGNIVTHRVNKTYDAVISLFHVISYLTTNQEVISAFKNAAKHLAMGGIFLFDVWYTPAVLSQRPESRTKCLENADYKVTRFAVPAMQTQQNVVDVNYTVQVQDKITGVVSEFQEKHSMRHFSIPEIDLICSLTGFERIQCEEFLTKRTPGDDTWGVCFVLKKK